MCGCVCVCVCVRACVRVCVCVCVRACVPVSGIVCNVVWGHSLSLCGCVRMLPHVLKKTCTRERNGTQVPRSGTRRLACQQMSSASGFEACMEEAKEEGGVEGRAFQHKRDENSVRVFACAGYFPCHVNGTSSPHCRNVMSQIGDTIWVSVNARFRGKNTI